VVIGATLGLAAKRGESRRDAAKKQASKEVWCGCLSGPA
jgi:hypothetical protein